MDGKIAIRHMTLVDDLGECDKKKDERTNEREREGMRGPVPREDGSRPAAC